MILTSLCYIENKGSFLLLYRNKKNGDINRGKWIGIGGKKEPGETMEECLLREVKEETGLTLLSYRYRGLVHFRPAGGPDEDMYLYTADRFSGELTPCDEGELHWVPKEEVLSLPAWEGDRYFLTRLLTDSEPFTLTLEYVGDTCTRHEFSENPMCYGMPNLIELPTTKENVLLCKELGLSFVELNMNFPPYLPKRLRETKEELRRLAAENGIFFTLHLPETLDVADFNDRIRKATWDTVREAIFLSREIGIPNVNFHMNAGVRTTLPDRKVYLYETYENLYLSCIRDFRDMVTEAINGNGIRLTVENTDGFHPFEKKAIECLLQSPVFGLTFDIGHAKVLHDSDLPFLLSHADRLCHFHLHDGTENPPKNHLAFGDGDIDLAARIALAKETESRAVVEVKTVAALKKSVQWLREKGELE